MDNPPIKEIDTNIERPHAGGYSQNAQRNYARNAKDLPMTSYIVNNNPHRAKMCHPSHLHKRMQ